MIFLGRDTRPCIKNGGTAVLPLRSSVFSSLRRSGPCKDPRSILYSVIFDRIPFVLATNFVMASASSVPCWILARS